MPIGTGEINVPLGGRQAAALLSSRSNVFLQGPLTVLPKIQIDFPLDGEYDFDLIPRNPSLGITVGELVDRVIDIYGHIYNQPATRARLVPSRAIVSSHHVAHDYGIYSHDLDELVLVEAEYEPSDGTIYLVVETI